jgi:hypothetical protein
VCGAEMGRVSLWVDLGYRPGLPPRHHWPGDQWFRVVPLPGTGSLYHLPEPKAE